MNNKALIFTLFTFISTQTFAENHMMIIGGGGEPTCLPGATSGKNAKPFCDNTIFDTSMKSLGANLANGNWNYQVSFNGGHNETERILSTEFKNSSKPNTKFTAANYQQMIKDYKAKILAGEIKQGDQFIVIVNTHGAEETLDSKTHLILASGGAISNLNTGAGGNLINLDDLSELSKLASDTGINMGIVDLSCHSGATLKLKSSAPNVCIVAATGPKHYSFAGPSTFSDSLLKNFRQGETLESAFLKARLSEIDPSYPMISTEENDQIVAEIYSKITPYLYFFDPAADKLTNFMLTNTKDTILCKREEDFKKLISSIDQLRVAANGNKAGYNGDELKRLLLSYKNTQDQILKSANKLGAGLLTKKESFIKNIGPNKKLKKSPSTFVLNLSWEEILISDPDEIISRYTDMLPQIQDLNEKARTLAALEAWKDVKAKKQSILTNYPEISNAKNVIEEMTKQIGKNHETVAKIARQEKILYDELYRSKQSMNFDDPCRKIKF